MSMSRHLLSCFSAILFASSTINLGGETSTTGLKKPEYEVLWNGENWDRREFQESEIETFLHSSPDVNTKAELYCNSLSALSAVKPDHTTGIANSQHVQNLVQNTPCPQLDWHLVNAIQFYEALQVTHSELKRKERVLQKEAKDDEEELRRYESQIRGSTILPQRIEEFLRLRREVQEKREKERGKRSADLKRSEAQFIECESHIKHEILSYLMLMFAIKKLENVLMAYALCNAYYPDPSGYETIWKTICKEKVDLANNKILSDIQEKTRNKSYGKAFIREELVNVASHFTDRISSMPSSPKVTYQKALTEVQRIYNQTTEITNAIRRKELKKALNLLKEYYPDSSALLAFAKISYEDRSLLLSFIEACRKSEEALRNGDTVQAKAVLFHIKELSIDFDLASAIREANKKEAEIQACLKKAYEAASRGDDKDLDLQIESLNKIASGNIYVFDQIKKATELGLIQRNKLIELDKLLKEWDVKKIYNWQKSQNKLQDKNRQQKLEEAIEQYQNQQASLEKVKAIAALPGGSYAAWEEADNETKKDPRNEELILFQKQLALKTTSYVEPLQIGDSMNAEKKTGSAFYYYLLAVDAYPEGKKAKDNLRKVAEEVATQYKNNQY